MVGGDRVVDGYLRVKNWREHQHYRDRRPPWIKLLRELIDGDEGRRFREQLSELEQWQLVRLWLYASGSDTVMVDGDGREVPLISADEQTLRMGIRSLRRVAVDKFVRLGFLERVDASAAASTDASTGASTLLGLEVESKRDREERHLRAVLDGSDQGRFQVPPGLLKDMPA